MPASRPALREACFGDYRQIAALQVRNGLAAMPCPAWTALWSQNPVWRRLGAWPIGWVLETDAGEIVGYIASIPVEYRFRGRELRGAVTGSWVTDPAYRGYSMLVLSAVMKQAGVDLFVTNTASPKSEATLRMLGWSRVPVGAWDASHFWVADCRGFARWVLAERRVPLPGVPALPLSLGLSLRERWVARRSPVAPRPEDVVPCAAFDGRFDEFWRELEARNPGVLLGVRSRETLEWHFNGSLARGTARIVTLNRGVRMIAYAIFDRADIQGLKRVRLIDFQALEGAGEALASFVARMLEEGRRTGVHVLESNAHPLERWGDPRRVAPYRRTLDAWRYYYKATSGELREALAAAQAWTPSYYDGDASL